MKWLGFGKGFTFIEETICTNVWSDAARQASIEARRASNKAYTATIAATDGNNLIFHHLSGYAKRLSEDAVRSEKENVGMTTPELHVTVAETHTNMATRHRALGGPKHEKAAKLHDKAAKAHGKAGLMHTQAEEVDWRPNETLPEDYYAQ